MNRYLTILFLLITSFAFTQTVKELEEELSWLDIDEEYGERIAIARKLLELDTFNYKAINYICNYYKDRKIDSISLFFDSLITKYPNNVEPYLLRSELLYFEIDDYTQRDKYNRQKVNFLKKALQINTSEKRVISALSEVYYGDFIFPTRIYSFEKQSFFIKRDENGDVIEKSPQTDEKEVKESIFEHSADSALFYFYKLWDLDKYKRELIYFPIRQLECYLNVTESPIRENLFYNTDYCYFSPCYFANLKTDWECDMTFDYLYEIDKSQWSAGWISTQLAALDEPCLYGQKVAANDSIYRFTWLRTFHNPIAIRIEKIKNATFIYWTVGKGSGGYEPKGIEKSGKRKVKENDWRTFINLTEELNMEKWPNSVYVPIMDGAYWILEQKTDVNFKAIKTKRGGGCFRECCLFLLKLTNIKVKVEDIY